MSPRSRTLKRRRAAADQWSMGGWMTGARIDGCASVWAVRGAGVDDTVILRVVATDEGAVASVHDAQRCVDGESGTVARLSVSGIIDTPSALCAIGDALYNTWRATR